MYSVMRFLCSDHFDIIEFLSLDSINRVYWTPFGPHITAFNDEDLAQAWVDKLNRDYGCVVCAVGLGPDYCDA